MEDFRTDDFQIIDMEILSMHCKQIDKDAKAMGLPNLADDFDVPKTPADTHRYLVFKTCADAFMKHNNPDMAAFYEKKAEKELLKIDNKYLTQRSALYIKENFIAGPLRIKPYQQLTKLPDA